MSPDVLPQSVNDELGKKTSIKVRFSYGVNTGIVQRVGVDPD